MLLRFQDGRRLTTIEEFELPCALSINQKGAPLFGGSPELPAAWIGLSNNRLFLQPGGDAVPVMLNGKKSTAPAWLSPGDTIGIGTAVLKLQQDAEGFLFSPEEKTTETESAQTDKDDAEKKTGAKQTRWFNRLPGKQINHRMRNIILVFFVFLMLAVIFVLIAVPVRITVTPQPEAFSLNGVLSIPIWDRYLVFPGTYSISAQKPGYHDLQELIAVSFSSTGNYTFALRELPGQFNITTQPVDGAEISIDNTVLGTTPLRNIELDKGSHILHITAQ